MTRLMRRLLFYFLPLVGNIGLIAYMVWQLKLVSVYDRHSDFLLFSILYAVGGAIMVVSGVTAFIHGTAQAAGSRSYHAYYALALINTIVPTVLLVVLLQAR